MISDNELQLLLINHPEKGIEKLMDVYAPLVYTIVYNKLSSVGTKEDIEECVSDIFYGVYKNRSNIDLSKGSIKAYLSVVAKRKSIDIFRKMCKTVNKNLYIDEMGVDFVDLENSGVEMSVINNETKNVLIKAIKELGEPDSEIFIRKYYFGQSTKLIAKVLKIKGNTIDKKVSRGLRKLEQLLGGVL